VNACLGGDETAWRTLVDRYKRLIYHFPVKASLPPEECDEVFQETLLALYRCLDRIQQVDDLSYWISRVAQRNVWRAVHRAKQGLELAPEYDVPDPDAIPQKQLELTVQQFKVRQALGSLNDKCRRLLTELFYLSDENNYKQISAKLGIAVGSIGPTRNRCLAKFRKALEKVGITEKNVSSWLD